MVPKPKNAGKAKGTRKRARKVLMSAGQMIGYLKLLQRVRSGGAKISPSIRKRWRVCCTGPITDEHGVTTICNKEFTIPEMYLRRNPPKTHCGCQISTLRSRYNNEYRIWLMVRERTRNPEHVANKHYVARGIDICDEWYDLETGFEKFFKEVGVRPSKNHTLDRIDNNRGYEPGNLRWATPAQQRANQGDSVAGYSEKQIIAAGYSREEFTQLIASGATPEELIDAGKDGE